MQLRTILGKCTKCTTVMLQSFVVNKTFLGCELHGFTKSRSVPLICVKTNRMINRFYETLCKQTTLFDVVILIDDWTDICNRNTLSKVNDRMRLIYPYKKLKHIWQNKIKQEYIQILTLAKFLPIFFSSRNFDLFLSK